MKQTKNHQLNLVEMSDAFSTEPLNQNMETIDAALKAASDATAAVSRRVVSLEAKNFTVGTYKGNGSTQSISVGFAPRGVIISSPSTSILALGQVISGTSTVVLLSSTGFTALETLNTKGVSYSYMAFD